MLPRKGAFTFRLASIRFSRGLAVLLVTMVVTSTERAWAWSDKISANEDSNTVCRLEPEAQCTQAVRIGLQAPGLDMHDASMPNMRLDQANLKGANLSGAIMQLANLRGANLAGANLERTHLHGVNLQGAVLRGANLRRANLLDANLRGADLSGADVTDAILIAATLDDALWIDGRICAKGSVGACR